MADKDFKIKNKLVVNGLTGGAGYGRLVIVRWAV